MVRNCFWLHGGGRVRPHAFHPALDNFDDQHAPVEILRAQNRPGGDVAALHIGVGQALQHRVDAVQVQALALIRGHQFARLRVGQQARALHPDRAYRHAGATGTQRLGSFGRALRFRRRRQQLLTLPGLLFTQALLIWLGRAGGQIERRNGSGGLDS